MLQAWFLITTPLFWLGIGKKYPFALLGEQGLRFGAYFWGILTILWLCAYCIPDVQEWAFRYYKKFFSLWVWIAILSYPAWSLLQYLYFKPLGYSYPTQLLLFEFLCILLLMIRFGPWHSKVKNYEWFGFLLLGLLHRAVSIHEFSLLPGRSDMLPAILEAGQRFLNHAPVYIPSTIPGVGQIPYLPGTWFSFLPSVLMGFDPRWLGLVYFTIASLIAWKITRHSHLGRSLLILYILNPYFQFRHELYFDFFLLLIAFIFQSLSKHPPWIVSILVGLLASTLQWGWFLAPFFIWMIPISKHILLKKKLHVLLNNAIWGSLVVIFSLGMFFLREGSSFWNAIFMHQHMHKTYYGELCFGLSPMLLPWVGNSILQKIQFGSFFIGIGIGLFRWWKQQDLGHIPVWILLVFIILNPLIENYFYLIPFWYAIFLKSHTSILHLKFGAPRGT